MKKVISWFLSIAIIVALCPSMAVNAVGNGEVATEFSSGDGTSSSPYIISTPAELMLASKKVNAGEKALCFRLAADLDLNNQEWTPIGTDKNRYSGTFDGNGYVVKNFKITSEVTYIGFFGVVETTAHIFDLGVENLTVEVYNKNSPFIGGFASRAGGIVENCYIANSSVRNLQRDGKEYALGSFAGSIRMNSTIKNSYAYNVKVCSSHKAYQSGFVGQFEGEGVKLENCYAADITVDTTGATEPSTASSTYSFGCINKTTDYEIKNCYTTVANFQGASNYYSKLTMIKTVSSKADIVKYIVKDDEDSVFVASSSVNNGYPYLLAENRNVTPEITPEKSKYAGGTGTEQDPYLISNNTQLAYACSQINSNDAAAKASYKLTADIDFGGEEWIPIGRSLPSYDTTNSSTVYTPAFSGTFDGDNHIISNLTIINEDRSKTSVTTAYCGFFGRCKNAKIKNLAIENMTIKFYNHDYYYTDSLKTRTSYSGVMVGEAYNTSFINCCVETSSVRNMQRDCADIALGGFVGNAVGSSSFENCYVYHTDICSGQNACLGGFFGYVSSGTPKFKNCFVADVKQNTSGTSHDGVLATTYGFGCSNGMSITTENCYSTLADVQGTHYCEWCISKVHNKSHSAGVSAMASDALIAKVMESKVYAQDNNTNGGYPYLSFGELKPATEYAGGSGTAEAPFVISTAAQLLLATNDVNSGWAHNMYFELANDIDYRNNEWIPFGHNTKDENGTSSTVFKGNFNGNGHIIKNLRITNAPKTYHFNQIGFFGYVQEATIKNLGIENITIEVHNCDNPITNERISYIGGFAAFIASSSIVENCYLKNSSVRQMCRDHAEKGLGGFVGGVSRRDTGGVSYYPEIKNCYVYNADIVSGQMVPMGGFVGTVTYGGDIKFTNCYAANITSTISDTTHSTTTSTTYGFGYKSESVVAVNCYSTLSGTTGNHTCSDCIAPTYDSTKAFGVSGASKSDIVTAFKDSNFVISDDINNGYPHISFEKSAVERDFMVKSVQPEITTVEANQYTVENSTTKKWKWETANSHKVTVSISRKPGVTMSAKAYVAIYDIDGGLIGVDFEEITSDEFQFAPDFSIADAVTLKVFVWNDTLTPVAENYIALPDESGYILVQQRPSDGTESPEIKNKTRVVLMGDSLMDSYINTSSGVDPKSGWEEYIGNYIDNDNITLIKHGHSGQTIQMFIDGRSTYHYCDWTSIKKQFGRGDYVIIALGTNDNSRLAGTHPTEKYSVDQFKTWYKDIISDVKAKGANIILLTPPPANSSVSNGEFYAPTSLAREALLALATEAKVDVIDITQAYATAINEYAKANNLSTSDLQVKYENNKIVASGKIFVDSVHFTAVGAELLAKQLQSRLR